MGGFAEEYRSKLKTAEEAVKVVKSGDWVEFSHFAMTPRTLDAALARRVNELNGVKIRAMTALFTPQTVQADPERKHFAYNSWHMSGIERKLHDRGLCNYIPMLFHESPRLYRDHAETDVALVVVAPMDEHGFFNFGPSNDFTKAMVNKASKVVVEVNDQAPYCLGGCNESIHISQVDAIVETSWPLPEVPNPVISETDQRIAALVMEEIEDGACLQLGIGAMANAVGAMIAQSDLKNLGVHTEMLVDSYVDMYEAGRVTGNNKTIDRGKMVYTFAMGTKRLYEFLNHNPICASYDVEYTNDPNRICLNDKVVAINNAVEVDLYGQVCSESSGIRHISGTGGQFDFIFGAFRSKGGKGLICLSSTYNNGQGQILSRIKPVLTSGGIVTVPRTVVEYVITEHGKAILKGKSTWERAEALISIADPRFQDELVREAEQMGIWLRTNRIA